MRHAGFQMECSHKEWDCCLRPGLSTFTEEILGFRWLGNCEANLWSFAGGTFQIFDEHVCFPSGLCWNNDPPRATLQPNWQTYSCVGKKRCFQELHLYSYLLWSCNRASMVALGRLSWFQNKKLGMMPSLGLAAWTSMAWEASSVNGQVTALLETTMLKHNNATSVSILLDQI